LRVGVSVNIEPGPAFNWNGVTWKGNSAIRSAQLDTAVTLKPGDLADGVKIEATWNRVRDLFGRLGYLDLKLDAAPQFDDAAKRVSYVVTITEGQQYRMGNLVISGLSVEGERRIRDAWKIPEGSLFDEVSYDQFLDTGVKEAFAGLPLHYDKIVRFVEEDSKAGTVNVMLDFQ
jgi:outer membrane protein insertion porin family